MLASLLLIACLPILTMRIRSDVDRIRVDQQGVCYSCRYDLSGTPPRFPCPECGRAVREQFRTLRRTHIVFTAQRLGWLAAMVPLYLLYSCLAVALAVSIFSSLYPAARSDVLRSIAQQECTALFWPVELAIGLSPLLAYVPARPVRIKLLAACLAAAALTAAAPLLF